MNNLIGWVFYRLLLLTFEVFSLLKLLFILCVWCVTYGLGNRFDVHITDGMRWETWKGIGENGKPLHFLEMQLGLSFGWFYFAVVFLRLHSRRSSRLFHSLFNSLFGIIFHQGRSKRHNYIPGEIFPKTDHLSSSENCQIFTADKRLIALDLFNLKTVKILSK